MWIQNPGILEGGRAEKVQVLGRYKYSEIPLRAPIYACSHSYRYILVIRGPLLKAKAASAADTKTLLRLLCGAAVVIVGAVNEVR